VEKYLSKSSETVKGHLNQQRMSARSTTIKEETKKVPIEGDLDYGIKTNCIYAATIDAGQIYTDQTGRSSVIYSKWNKYIMVWYEYDDNAILAEPIKNRTSPYFLKAFQVM
jgi:predicted transglutaminase-like protease